jgi:GNAT superfamily N-acetyltransferase
MRIDEISGGYALYKEADEIGRCLLAHEADAVHIARLVVAPEWRRRGYGSYLLKEILRRYGGYAREQTSCFTAPLPRTEAEAALFAKFGFVPEGDCLVRRRKPDLTAVQFVHDFLAAHLPAAQFAIDATCGNGGDTVFLCRLAQKVLAMDIQPQAIESTRRRLAQEGLAEPEGRVQLVCDSHANLLRYAAPGSADAVLFNFGWLPGAEHAVFSTAASSIPALEAALTALRTGGILSAVLYSGKCIGSDEKQAVLAWLRALPLTQYTVLICEFANWAETAPLPCFVIKK